MSDMALAWQEANNQYLVQSLHWLRLRLEQLATGVNPEAMLASAVGAVPQKRGLLKKMFGSADAPAPVSAADADAAAKAAALRQQLADALSARQTAADAASAAALPPPALLELAGRFALSDFERDTLLLCAAMEFDPAIGNLCARIHGNPQRNYPSFSLAMSALDDPGWDAMSPQRPLRSAQLLEVAGSGHTPAHAPLTASPLRADERVVNYLKGLNQLDERMRSLTEALPDAGAPLSASQQKQAQALLQRLQAGLEIEQRLPVVQLLGADEGSRLQLAQAVCTALGRDCFCLRLDLLPAQLSEVVLLARLWQRESLLLPVALYVDADGLSDSHQTALRHFLTQEVGVVLLGVAETEMALGSHSFTIECSKPDAGEQRQYWQQLLGDGAQGEAPAAEQAAQQAALLAGQFDLNLGEIGQIQRRIALAPDNAAPLPERLWDACRDLTRPRLDSLAQRLTPKATWEDLVLPPEQMAIMQQIVAQVRGRHQVYGEWGFGDKMNRGFGISALFAGESGTGKTMAAEVIANALRLNLYRIDLSQVVSKYIGETEKNLRKLFDAAECGGAILFFDEADALFGKRSEVKDSHDRYANIEINYLLQRMESFSGLAILATNLKGSLDTAFMRRLRFIVQFPYPGINERLAIWQSALPQQVPVDDLDFSRLARLNVSGGNIHSIVLNAAFMAASKGVRLDMPLLLAAARAEMKKLEKPVVEAEFRDRNGGMA